jgi:hypothetical protein
MIYKESSRRRYREYDRTQELRRFGDDVVKKARREREQERVRKAALDIATSDPTQIVQVRRCCCRWCWGDNHEYQRSDWEIQRDLDRFIAGSRKGAIFNQMGGGGYSKFRDANPDCPICLGYGEEQGVVKDFRKLSARERNLIAGVKFGKNGTVEEIKFHNKIDAINTFAKLDGMIIEKKIIRVVDATEQELNEYFKQHQATIDYADPELAPFIAKMNGAGPTVSDAEAVDIVDDFRAGEGPGDVDERNPGEPNT